MLLHWTRTSNDLCEEEQVNRLVNGTWAILVRVVILPRLVGGGEAGSGKT